MSPDDTTVTKTCTKCGRIYPATTEYFPPNGQCNDYLAHWCRNCTREYQSSWRKRNPDKIKNIKQRYRAKPEKRALARSYGRQYYAKNRENERKRHHLYHIKNKDNIRERKRQNRLKNLEKERERHRVFYRLHNEEIRRRRREQYAQNPEKFREKGRRSRRRNLMTDRIKSQRRRALKHKAEGTYTPEDVALLIKSQTDKKRRLHCWWCGKVIKGIYHLDHKIPLIRGGTNWPDNLCISCPICNFEKKDKTPQEWIGRLF